MAAFDCMHLSVACELQLRDTVHDVQYLHNETMFAVAQEQHTYIYDNKGVEIHCMTRHERPFKLDYLPYHYLLTTVGTHYCTQHCRLRAIVSNCVSITCLQ